LKESSYRKWVNCASDHIRIGAFICGQAVERRIVEMEYGLDALECVVRRYRLSQLLACERHNILSWARYRFRFCAEPSSVGRD
jgi:hypothetical protein